MTKSTTIAEQKYNPAVKAFAGLFGISFYVLIGIVLIIIGILLSLTIIGAIIGVPLIIFGIFMAILSPLGMVSMFKVKQQKAVCPYCQNWLMFSSVKAFDCQYCKKRLLVKGDKLVLVQ